MFVLDRELMGFLDREEADGGDDSAEERILRSRAEWHAVIVDCLEI
jgi:hypothetical protein